MVTVFSISLKGLSSNTDRTVTFSTPVDYLNGQAHIDRLLKTAQQYAAIKEDCKRLMPLWFGQCRILRLEDGVLSISAPNQALAARIRQSRSLLLHGLKSRGWEISQIRPKVSLDFPTTDRKPLVQTRRFSKKARASFEALYRKLEEDGSQSDLRDSLKKLLDHR
ncbi:MAG: DciA family protein [Oxalobacter sp.]